MNVEDFCIDVFNGVRHYFTIPDAQWDKPFGTYRAAQVGMTLLYFAAFIAFVSGVWVWLFLPTVLCAVIPVAGLAGMGCAVSGLRALGSDQDTKVLGRLTAFDASFFMPYCICPKCDVEALHDMRAPDVGEITRALVAFKDRCERFARDTQRWPSLYSHMMMPPEPGRLAAIGLEFSGTKDLDVIRTCVDCGHSWGQRVGLVMPTEAIAEADAPTLRAPKTDASWVSMNLYKDE